ncbi:MAG: tetratricopeptide repeat protein [Clostridiales Family XIII bacterium]|jgi:tetratricopeptide (TPR) repeat protein|nr:tetratricopeptide repeat protein [Clostridiales Family XIII bacterium]
MTHWEILGIQETTDGESIRAAYLEKLPSVHPEEDPDGFRELREAYEAALHAAEAPPDEDEDDSLSGAVMRTIRAICSDFARRIDPEQWREALADERCTDLATQGELSRKLLEFLMEGFYMPQAVWSLLDDFFAWRNQEEALRSDFPDNYIDYVLSCISNEEEIRAAYFTASNKAKYELLTNRCYKLRNAISGDKREKAAKLIATIDRMNLPHPDYLAYKLDFLSGASDDGAEKTARQMLELYPDDARILFKVGEYKQNHGRPEEAIPLLIRALEFIPEHFGARAVLAAAYEQTGMLEQSKELCELLLLEYRYSSYVLGLLARVDTALIPVYEEALQISSGDAGLRFKLISCYYSAGRYEDALSVAEATKPNPEDAARYGEICFNLLLRLNDDHEPIKQRLLDFLAAWEENETTRLRLCGLPHSYYSIGEAEIAEEKANLLLDEFPGDAQLCYTLTLVYRDRRDISAAINAAETGLAKNPDDGNLLRALAEIYYFTEAYGDALEVIRRALQYMQHFYDMRLLEMRIYYICDEYDALLRSCMTAESYGMSDTAVMAYKMCAVYRLDRQPDDVIAPLKQVLKQQPDNEIALATLASAYLQIEEYAKAIRCYNKLIKRSPFSGYYADRGYAYGLWERSGAEIRDYRKAVEIDPDNAYAHYRLGVTFYMKNKMAGAVQHLERARELAPSLEAVRIYLIKTYSESGEFEKACEVADEGILNFADTDANAVRRLYREKLDACVHNNRYEDGRALAKYVVNAENATTDGDACRLLGDCCFETGRDDEAAEWYSRAFAADDTDWENWHRYAYFCRFGLKDKLSAMKAYKKAIKYRPDFWADYIHLANLNLELGKKAAARKLFISARDMLYNELEESRYPCAYYFLAECYLGLGDSEGAEKCAKRARMLAKKYTVCVTHNCYEASFLLARICKSQGKNAAARRYYEQTIAVSQDREYVDAQNDFTFI